MTPRGLLSRRLRAVCLAAVAFAVFAHTLAFEFVYDDASQVVGNPWIWNVRYLPNLLTKAVWSFKGDQPSNYYRPVQMLLYFLVARVGGKHPLGFHLASVLVHALATAAAYLLLRRVTDEDRAACAALLFAVHPAHVESVAWIAGSTDLNCGLLVFVALAVWWRVLRASGRRRVALAALWGLLFFLALGAKETAIVLPALALALPRPASDGAPAGPARGAPRWREVALTLVISGVVVAVYLGVRLRALGGLSPLNRHPDLSPSRLVANGLALVPRYLLVVFWPWRLLPDRVFEPASGLLDPWAIAGALLLAGGAALAIRLRRTLPAISFGVALLLLPLLPVLQVQYVGSNAQADRYLYIPALGACLLLVEVLARVGRHRAGAAGRRLLAGACALLAALAVVRTVTASALWSDDETLARAGIALEPRSMTMRFLLAGTLDREGRVDEGYRVAAAAVAIDPTDRSARASFAGFRAQRAKTPQEEIAIYKEVLAADPYQPYMWASLSAACLRARRFDDAVTAGERALTMDPNNVEAIVNLSAAHGALADFVGQEREARHALDLDQESALGWLNLGLARLAQKDLVTADEAARRATSLDPKLGRAHFCLSYIASSRGAAEEEAREAERAVELSPQDATLWVWLGSVRERRGDREGARRAYEQALALAPGDRTATKYLQRLMSTSSLAGPGPGGV